MTDEEENRVDNKSPMLIGCLYAGETAKKRQQRNTELQQKIKELFEMDPYKWHSLVQNTVFKLRYSKFRPKKESKITNKDI